MRYAVACAAAAAAFLLQSPSAEARSYPTAPWCSYVNTGLGNVVESCVYGSFEACRRNVLSGNRGFCNANPYIRYGEPVERPVHRHYRGR